MAASLVSFSPSSLTVLRLPTSRRPVNSPNKLGNRSCTDPKLSHRIEPLTTSVRRIIAKQLSVDETTVTPRTKFPDLGVGAGSGDTVELMAALEEELEVSIGEEAAENLYIVQDDADQIEKLKPATSGIHFPSKYETLGRSYHQDFYPVLKKFIVFFFKFIFY